MKAVFQRVYSAKVTVEGKITGEIGPGALILLGVEQGDTPAHAALMAKKIAELRVFCDDRDKMNRSLIDTKRRSTGGIQFHPMRRLPSRSAARFFPRRRPETAEPLYALFMEELRRQGVSRVEAGRFGAHMQVQMEGNGPVTILLDTRDWIRASS